MPPMTTDSAHIDALLSLLAKLGINSAQRVLANRNSIGSMASLLKEMYEQVDIQRQLIYSANPFLTMIPKSDNFTGKYIPLPKEKK